MTNPESSPLQVLVPDDLAGKRLDQALAVLFPDYSRSRLQQWIRDGLVCVDGRQLAPRDKLWGGEQIAVNVPQEVPQASPQAQELPLEVVYEDASLLVINKAAGMVVHPAAGNREGTLLNALLHHAPELAAVPRAGIVHRLDKETTGLLVVARTLTAQTSLVRQLQERTLERQYEAVVNGVLTGGGSVDAPMGRHVRDRKRMAVLVAGGKPAVSHYRVVERFRAHTHVRVNLETGRTHQIRVHMAHIRHPLVGDPVYGGRLRLPPHASEHLAAVLRGFRRQALHAARLGLVHPESGEHLSWEAPLPADMVELLAALREDARQ